MQIINFSQIFLLKQHFVQPSIGNVPKDFHKVLKDFALFEFITHKVINEMNDFDCKFNFIFFPNEFK